MHNGQSNLSHWEQPNGHLATSHCWTTSFLSILLRPSFTSDEATGAARVHHQRGYTPDALSFSSNCQKKKKEKKEKKRTGRGIGDENDMDRSACWAARQLVR